MTTSSSNSIVSDKNLTTNNVDPSTSYSPSSSSSSSSTNERCCTADKKPNVNMGDHVFIWCRFMGVPQAFQHHAIVLDVYWREEMDDNDDDDDDNDEDDQHDNNKDEGNKNRSTRHDCGGGQWFLKVVDYSNIRENNNASHPTSWISTSGPRQRFLWTSSADGDDGNHINNNDDIDVNDDDDEEEAEEEGTDEEEKRKLEGEVGYLRTYETPSEGWHKVEYGVPWWKSSVSRFGTCTRATCDAPALVRARVRFLLEDPQHRLPMKLRFHSVFANCECVAVWCKTGTWATVQGISWLTTTVAGGAKATATVAGAAAAATTTVTTTVPAAGLWGWLGYTTTATAQVSLVSAQPWIIPAIAAYGVVSIGVPMVTLVRAQLKWKTWTMEMNQAFWEDSVSHPDLFVELLLSQPQSIVSPSKCAPSSGDAEESEKKGDNSSVYELNEKKKTPKKEEAENIGFKDGMLHHPAAGKCPSPSAATEEEESTRKNVLGRALWNSRPTPVSASS